MGLIRHQYGPEGYAYVRAYLEGNEGFGGRLGPLLQRRNIEGGVVWALVPAASSSADRLDFEQGAPFLGRRADGCPMEQLDRWLRSLLSPPSPTPGIFCMEDALTRRTDGGLQWVLSRQTWRKVFFCGERVYWYATADPAQTAPLLTSSATWDPDIAMVTTLPPEGKSIEHRESIRPELLERLAAAALAIVIGAWDADGFVVWEPPTDAGSQQTSTPLAASA